MADDAGMARTRAPWLVAAASVAVLLLLAGCTTADLRGVQESGSSPGGVPTAQAALDAALLDAAWDDDVAEARRLVAQGADVNAKDETQQSAYLVATSEGHLDLLELTLAAGAVVDDKDSWNGTGLIRAAERGHHLVVGRLLRAGIDKDHVNRIGYQAVHEAVWFGADEPDELATVRVLVAAGVQLDRPSVTERLTPLEMARQRGYARLERMLDAASRHRPAADPDAALLAAARTGDADAVALALRDGARIEAADEEGRTALELAEDGDHEEAASVLAALGW
jgi:ankyrin repeat protein